MTMTMTAGPEIRLLQKSSLMVMTMISMASANGAVLVLVVATVGTDDGVADDRVVKVGPVAVVAADACFDFLMNLGEFLGGRPRRFFPMAFAGLSCCK